METSMDIRNIKKQADEIYLKYRNQIIPEFFYIGYVSILAQYLQSGLFSFFVSLFLCPIAHGYVCCAIKLVDQEDATLDYQDSLVGIIDFVRVAPAYLAKKAIILLLSMIAMVLLCSICQMSIPAFSLELISTLGNAFIQTDFFIPNLMEAEYILNNISVLFVVFVSSGVYLLLTTLFMAVPYIIEEDEYSWLEALQYSFHLIKKNIISYCQLYFLYFPRHIAYGVCTGFISLLVGQLNEILMLFCLVFSLFFYIDVFKGRFEIAKYIYYKEIRGDKNEGFINS